MQNNFYSVIGFIALIIHVIINFEFIGKPRINLSKANKSYQKYIYAVGTYYMADAVWGIANNYHHIKLLYIDTVFYYIAAVFSVVFWCKYVVAYLMLENITGKIFNFLGSLFCIGQIIALFINHFVHIFFWIDNNGVYHVYAFRYIVLTIQIILFFAITLESFITTLKSSGTKKRRNITICLFGFEMVVTAIIQTIYPLLPIYSMGIMIGNCVLHVFVLEDEKDEFRKILEKNEKQLKESTDIIANAGFGLWKINMRSSGHYTMIADDTLQQILGISEMHLGPEELYTYYHKRLHHDVTEIEQNDYQDMLKGNLRTHILCWEHPTKGEIYIRVAGTSHILENGEPIISGYCVDVTEQKLEAERLNASLEQARKQAEAANRAKTVFLFNMSHDIRTPMNAIIGFTDLLEKNYQNKEKCEDYIRKIRNSSQFLLSLINNVLEIARIESGKSVLDESICNIEAFTMTLRSVFEEQMKEKHITFTIDVNVKHTNILGDATKLKEIYLNLLSNAYKYTPPGGSVSLKITEFPSEQEGYCEYQVIVADTGIGMSKEFLPKLFNEFVREHSYTENKIEGTGLGMPIVKKFVDLMGGTLTVESELGKGTTFVLTILHKIVDRNVVEKEDSSIIDTSIFKGKRILLAEDNDLNAEIAIEILSDEGFLVERAEDGIICVDMISKKDAGYYDVILMDIQMPNMDGHKATEAIRHMEDDEKASIPIIAMTANAFEEDKQKALSVGMNSHLAKPINVRTLVKELANILG